MVRKVQTTGQTIVVIDGTHEMKLNVEDVDVTSAKQGDSKDCAIAQCVKRDPSVIDVQVGASTVFVRYANRIERYILSPQDRKRISVFDSDGYFKSGEYTLLPPPDKRKIGARAGTKPGSNVRKAKAASVDRAKPIRGTVSPGKF